MEDVLQRVFALLLSVIIFFLLPLYMAFEKKDDISYSMALRITSNFVDNVENKGYISKKMYLDYISNLALTGNDYDVSLLHTQKKYYPVIYAKQKDASGNITAKEYDYISYKSNYDKYIDENEKKTTIEGITYEVGTNNYLELNYKMVEIEHTDKEILANCEDEIHTVGRTYEIDQNYVYPMSKGDEFTVVIKNTNTTIASILFNTLTMGINNGNDTKVYINYGGSIQNESYRKNAIIGESSKVENTWTEAEGIIINSGINCDIVMANTDPVGIRYGDVNNDGTVDIKDSAIISRSLNGQYVLTDEEKHRGNVNLDNIIDSKDADIIKNYCSGNIDSILCTKSNTINFFLKFNSSLGDNPNDIKNLLRSKLEVGEKNSIDDIYVSGKKNNYFVYRVAVKAESDADHIILRTKEGIEAKDGTKYDPMERVVSIIKNNSTTVGCNIVANQSSPTKVYNIEYTITFDRDVNGFDINDIEWSASGISNFKKITNSKYTVVLHTASDFGIQKISVKENSCEDVNGNKNSKSNQCTVVIDNKTPEITIDKTGRLNNAKKIQIMGKVSDKSSSVKLNFYISEVGKSNNKLVGTKQITDCSSEKTYTYEIVGVNNITSSVYNVTVEAIDEAGNTVKKVYSVTPGPENKIF